MKKNTTGTNTRLVYSTDPAVNKKCDRCKELISECVCPEVPQFTNAKFVAYLRLEKAGRGGKTVTVIDDLPKDIIFLKELTTELKKKCGSGGTHAHTHQLIKTQTRELDRSLVRNLDSRLTLTTHL